MSLVFDFGSVKTIKEMPDGSLKAYARIAVANHPYVYRNRDGSSVTRKISKEELFKPQSVNTLKVQVVTNDHPSEPVTPANYKKYAVGSTGDSFTTGFDEEFLGGIISVVDAQAIAAVKAGKRQVSPGYGCKIINLDGQDWQVNRSYNHLALVDMARGGADCRLKDSADFADDDTWMFDSSQIDRDLINYWAADSPGFDTHAIDRLLIFGTLTPAPIQLPMYTKITIDGIELEVNPAHVDLASQLNVKIAQSKLALDSATNDRNESFSLTAKLAALTAVNTDLQSQVDAVEKQIKDGISSTIAAVSSAQTEIEIFRQGKVDVTAAKLCLDASDISGYKTAIVSAIQKKPVTDPSAVNLQYEMSLDAFMNFAGSIGQNFIMSPQERKFQTVNGGGAGLALRTMGAGESPGYEGASSIVQGLLSGAAMNGLPPMDENWSK